MLGHISAVPLRDDLPRHESARPEAALRGMLRSNLVSELDKLLDTPGGLSAAEQERVPPTRVPAGSRSEPSRRRFSAPAISFGIALYLISVGLVAGATIAVFFGAGFLLLVPPAGETISGISAYDPRIDAQSAASDPLTASSAEVAASSIAPAGPGPVADAAPPPETNDAAGNSAALPSEGDAPTGVAGDNVAAGSDAPAARPISAPPEPAMAAPAAASPILHLSPAEISDLLERGDEYLRVGDLASARLFYERAAVAGDSRAALRLAATFDPDFLSRAGLRSARGDAAEARLWYSRALDLGAAETKHRPESLATKQGR